MKNPLVDFDEFKGSPVIRLSLEEGDRYPVSIGKGKAKKAVENLEEISEAVEIAERQNARFGDVILTLDPDSRYPWKITLSQAMRIVKNIEALAEWAEEDQG